MFSHFFWGSFFKEITRATNVLLESSLLNRKPCVSEIRNEWRFRVRPGTNPNVHGALKFTFRHVTDFTGRKQAKLWIHCAVAKMIHQALPLRIEKLRAQVSLPVLFCLKISRSFWS